MKSGDGGPGCVAFHREKFIEMGGPDGGNGGKGGDIIIEAVKTLNTLIDFRYTQHFKAQNGANGAGRLRSGKGGDDLLIRIPVGTQILAEDKETVLLDLIEDGQRMIFLRGGDGGFGNAHYKSATNQAPRKMTPGWKGQEMAGLAAPETDCRCRPRRPAQCREIELPRRVQPRQPENRRLSVHDIAPEPRRRPSRRQ